MYLFEDCGDVSFECLNNKKRKKKRGQNKEISKGEKNAVLTE